MARIQTQHPTKKLSNTSTLLILCALSFAVFGSMIATDIFSISTFSKSKAVSLGDITMTFSDPSPAYRVHSTSQQRAGRARLILLLSSGLTSTLAKIRIL